MQYTVRPGDTLSKIAKQFYGDPSLYMVIFEANRDQLRDPNVVRVGQVLEIPEGGEEEVEEEGDGPEDEEFEAEDDGGDDEEEEGDGPLIHVIEPGDTLSALAKHYYGNAKLYLHIFEANRDKMPNPNAGLRPGDEIIIPSLDDEE